MISHKEEISSIKPYFSFILIPDERFKAKIKLAEFAQKNKKIKNEILKMRKKRKHLISEIQTIKTLFLNRESEKKITLMDQIVSQPDEQEEKDKLLFSSTSKLLELKKVK